MDLTVNCNIELPEWVSGFVSFWQEPLTSVSQRMQLAIALSKENVRQETGGPFGAIVVNEGSGELVSVGVNLVTSAGLSMAHAEIIALSMAQSATGEWNLAKAGRLQLVSSCEPCAMCFGALPWSGINSLVCGARKEDAEEAGFDEGDKPDQWVASLHNRGIEVQRGVLRSEAASVLTHYRDTGGPIYNASHGHEED